MKLRNKETGEIGYLTAGRGVDYYVVVNNEWVSCGKYNSLAELNEEWEDYGELKEYWFIENDGDISSIGVDEDFAESLRASKEEAEKAVEKLKAWKRLESCGFKFKGWRTADLGADKYYFVITAESDGASKGDLDFLFGGEE